MATFEGMGFCDKQEYQSAFATRLQYADLTRDDLYVARFELARSDRAYRIMGRVGLVAASVASKDMARVDIGFVDNMLEPMLPAPVPGFMSDGVWKPIADFYVHEDKNATFQVLNACLGSYEGNVGPEFEALLMLELERDLTPL